MRTEDRFDRRRVNELERFLKGEAARARDSIRSAMAERSQRDGRRSADLLVWATETVQDEMQVALMDRLNHQVSQIEAALERLARREYGICRDCGEVIGLARLKALPFAQRCRPCQARAEEFDGDRTPAAVGVAGGAFAAE